MRCPSGDQFGFPQSLPDLENSCWALDPSASLTQIPRGPLRRDSNAIRLPSGEYCAAPSVRVQEINGLGAPAATPGADSERRHILVSQTARWYASRLPLREMVGYSPVTGSGSGSPAAKADTFQRLMSAINPKLKMMSRPSGVQAKPKR